MDRRAFLTFVGAVSVVGLLLAPGRALAQDAPLRPFQEITAAQDAAVARGLRWLKFRQRPDGSIGRGSPVALTAIAGLAFLAGGHTPTRGEYAPQVRGALEYLMRCCDQRTGYINEGAAAASGSSGMQGHGYALLFLAELYGMCGDVAEASSEDGVEDSLRECLARAIRCTAQAQHPGGGWTYVPHAQGHQGAVTLTQVQALRAARNAGLMVPKGAIERGIGHLSDVLYAEDRTAHLSFAMVAAGACLYACCGLHETVEGRACMTALVQIMVRDVRNARRVHDAYALFQAAQACFFMKEQDAIYWTGGYDLIRARLLSQQDPSGGWLADGHEGVLATSFATLALQIPYRYLPAFQD